MPDGIWLPDYCVFKGPGVLIEVLHAVHSVKRIAYVDTDVHHGDGVFYAFESDPDLWIAAISIPVSALPIKPARVMPGFIVSGRRRMHISGRQSRRLLIFQCGADSTAGDPITHMRSTPAAHARAASGLRSIANEFCQGRLIAPAWRDGVPVTLVAVIEPDTLPDMSNGFASMFQCCNPVSAFVMTGMFKLIFCFFQ